MTNSTGRMVNKYSYGPYGERLAMIEGTHNPFGYIGRWGVMEEGDGLKFMRARFYDQTTGRFLNLDPLGFRAGVNPYVYVQNNPVNSIDPRGLEGFGFSFSPGDFNPAVQYTPQTNDTSSFGDNFASYMDANGQHVINYMSSNYVQNGLNQFAWGEAASPQELLFVDDSA
jgi:RHS repeat-associated protein